MTETRAPYTVTIHHPERRAEWLAVFKTDTLPIKAPIPTRVNLPGIPDALIYLVDTAAITPDQRRRLVAHIAKKFSHDPEFVEAGLDEHGLPVLADEVTMTSTQIGLLL